MQTAAISTLFEYAPTPKERYPLQSATFPVSKKRRLASPSFLSRIPRGTDVGVALSGAEMQGLPLLRQGEEIAAVLEARKPDGSPLYHTVGIMLPRRAAKTTSIWSWILGKCLHQPGTKVVTTAQDGIRARNRFREVQRILDASDFTGEKDPTNRLGKLRWANGDEAIEFDNGSRIWVVPPEAGAFRGEAADLMFFDEAGELSVMRSEDLLAGALPLMDTRPGGQVVIAGTPGLERAGLLWNTLESGRAKEKGYGVVEYSIGDHEQLATWSESGERVLNRDLICKRHPGIGTLTTYERIKARFGGMPIAQFEREYGCRFPFEAATSAISGLAWEECLAEGGLPLRPDRVGLAFDVTPDSGSGALACAWRDEHGVAHGEILAVRPGTDWITQLGRKAFLKHRSPIAYDAIGANTDPADRLHRAHVSLKPQQLKDIQAASARLVQEIEARNFRHYRQSDLDDAVSGAAWRDIGDGGRLFARKKSTSNVSPLVAISLALRQFDRIPERQAIEIITA